MSDEYEKKISKYGEYDCIVIPPETGFKHKDQIVIKQINKNVLLIKKMITLPIEINGVF